MGQRETLARMTFLQEVILGQQRKFHEVFLHDTKNRRQNATFILARGSEQLSAHSHHVPSFYRRYHCGPCECCHTRQCVKPSHDPCKCFWSGSTFVVSSSGWSRVVLHTLSTHVSLLLFSDLYFGSTETVLQLVELQATGEKHDAKRCYPMWMILLAHSIKPREA